MEGLGTLAVFPRDLLVRVLLSFSLKSLEKMSQASKMLATRVRESLELRASRARFPSGGFSSAEMDFDVGDRRGKKVAKKTRERFAELFVCRKSTGQSLPVMT